MYACTYALRAHVVCIRVFSYACMCACVDTRAHIPAACDVRVDAYACMRVRMDTRLHVYRACGMRVCTLASMCACMCTYVHILYPACVCGGIKNGGRG